MRQRAIVVVGGPAPWPGVAEALPPAELVVAADSGYDHARRLGLDVDVLVGDLDSVSNAGRAAAFAPGGPVIVRHRPDKDATDTELALAAAIERGATELVGVAGTGGRLDHHLGTLAAWAGAALDPRVARVELWVGTDHVRVLVGPCPPTDLNVSAVGPLTPGSGGLMSLLAVGGAVTGLTTFGLRYPLTRARLSPTVTLGVSNVVVGTAPTLQFDEGILFVITPGAPT